MRLNIVRRHSTHGPQFCDVYRITGNPGLSYAFVLPAHSLVPETRRSQKGLYEVQIRGDSSRSHQSPPRLSRKALIGGYLNEKQLSGVLAGELPRSFRPVSGSAFDRKH